MKLIAPADASIVVLGNVSVAEGQVVDVPDEHVEGLELQGWTRAASAKKRGRGAQQEDIAPPPENSEDPGEASDETSDPEAPAGVDEEQPR